ncbi:energy-coupling factor transporter transmembrane component T [Streptomyces sp. 8N114]|uniref:energy-coupling factor transporter transmembrane component T n=1 Tax=Streptomyces sp. 8N114 TaxID=3457419 RepID=UPI003FD038D5
MTHATHSAGTGTPGPLPPPPSHRGFLGHINPLVKLGVALLAMGVAYLAQDPRVPAGLLCAAAVAYLAGTLPRPGPAVAALAVAGLALCWFTVLFSLLASAETAAGTPTAVSWGPLNLSEGAVRYGALIAFRLGAIVVLSLLAGAGTSPERLRVALVTQARVPYRFAYAALAGLQFVPVFRAQAATIQDAHRTRGATVGRGPLNAARRWARMMVPLMAGGIRHAERVSLAMDARGFGAHQHRTERTVMRFTKADALYAALSLALTAAIASVGRW